MNRKLLIPVLGLIAGFYLLIAPHYIQGGDTAELVNASFHLFVPHPPGYPFFLWLEHLWTHSFVFGTVFWRASILTSFFGLATLAVFGKSRTSIFALMLILALGTQGEFVEASVLPDIFSLHALLVALFGSAYLFLDNKAKRAFLVPYLFFLSCGNHHTTVFLVPCLVHAGLEAWGNGQKKKFLVGAFMGATLTTALYLSLILCHPLHPLSWGEVTDFSSLVSHMLRKDYGTFRLSTSDEAADFGPFVLLMKTLLPYMGALAVSLYFLVKNKVFDSKLRVWSVVLLLSVMFTFFMNVRAEYIGEEIVKRFHVMPLVVLGFWLLYTFPVNKKGLSLLVLLPAIFVNLYHLPKFWGLQNDSIIEDYSRNLFEAGKKFSPAIIRVDNDSAFFGVRYIQAFSESKNVAVGTSQLFFHPWFNRKIKAELPDFQEPKIEHELSIAEDLVKPNFEKINFIMVRDYKDGDWYKVTFLKLGRLVEKGEGIHFLENKIEFVHSELPVGPQHFTRGYLYNQYSYFYMARAFQESKNNELMKVKQDWEEAVKVVPYAFQAMSFLCELDKAYAFCSEENLKKVHQETKYFY